MLTDDELKWATSATYAGAGLLIFSPLAYMIVGKLPLLERLGPNSIWLFLLHVVVFFFVVYGLTYLVEMY